MNCKALGYLLAEEKGFTKINDLVVNFRSKVAVAKAMNNPTSNFEDRSSRVVDPAIRHYFINQAGSVEVFSIHCRLTHPNGDTTMGVTIGEQIYYSSPATADIGDFSKVVISIVPKNVAAPSSFPISDDEPDKMTIKGSNEDTHDLADLGFGTDVSSDTAPCFILVPVVYSAPPGEFVPSGFLVTSSPPDDPNGRTVNPDFSAWVAAMAFAIDRSNGTSLGDIGNPLFDVDRTRDLDFRGHKVSDNDDSGKIVREFSMLLLPNVAFSKIIHDSWEDNMDCILRAWCDGLPAEERTYFVERFFVRSVVDVATTNFCRMRQKDFLS